MIKSNIAIVLTIVLSTGVFAQQRAVDDLRWISGCWESTNKKTVIAEQWMKPAGGMMLGVGRTVKDNRAVDFEFMRIEQKGTDVFFIAKPKANKDETPFKLIEGGPFKAVFENLEHDFPQRVIYRREGDKLTGRIEGSRNGKQIGIDFPMTRVKCD